MNCNQLMGPNDAARSKLLYDDESSGRGTGMLSSGLPGISGFDRQL